MRLAPPALPLDPAGSPPAGSGEQDDNGHVRVHRDRTRRGRLFLDRGASPIELAILLPVVVVALFLSIQIAVYYLAREQALGAAQAYVTAERQYGVDPSKPAGVTAATNAGNNFLATQQSWLSSPEYIQGPYGATEVSVAVRGKAISLIPFMTFWVDQIAYGTVEQTAP